MVTSLRSLGSLGWIFGIATLGVGLAFADPAPIRPLKPRGAAKPDAKVDVKTDIKPAAKPDHATAKLPVCGKRRGIQPNGPDFTSTAIAQNPACAPLPQLQMVKPKAGVTLDGKTLLKDFDFVDGQLKSASQPNASLVGAMLLGESESGQQVRLRIDAVENAPDPDPKTPINENAELRLYRVSAQQGQGRGPTDDAFRPNLPPTGQFTPLCPEGKAALLVPGTWEYSYGQGHLAGAKLPGDGTQLTFACVGSAVAKCAMQWQYKPWRSLAAKDGRPAQSLDALHQACVRAARADYCGDGESMTQRGEQLNLYDRFGVEQDAFDWPLEAVWNAEGALCINSTRLTTAPENLNTERAAMPVLDYIKQHCPTRLSDKPCDRAALAAKGALIWTEAAPKAAAPKSRN